MNSARDRLEVCLLGGFSMRVGVEQMPPLPSRIARLLFAYLILRPGEPQPRSVLADLFWPDVPETRGRRRLSHALWQLQDALAELSPSQTFLHAAQDAVSFDSTCSYWLDVEEFEARLDRVDATSSHDASVERDLRRCVDLYRGDLLAGHYEPWVTVEQQRLEQRYLTALTQLVEVCRTQGNFRDALTFARRITHQDPLREDSHREVMRLCVLLDQPSQALEQYERCRSVLAEELGTEPAAETVALFERVAAARTQVAPTSARPHHLVSDHLVGREHQRTTLVDQLERALAGRSGVAMVEGPPGVGKSQLLTQVADDATWRGFSVYWGTCHDSAAPTAYGALREALGALPSVRVAQLRHALDPVWMAQAAPVLGTLAGDSHTGQPRRTPSPERADLVREALCQVLIELARQDPLLLVVDDVQWADAETLALLAHLTRRTDVGRMLVLLGFRDQEARADEGVWGSLRLLDRNAMPRRISLGPLSAFEVGELVADVLDLPRVPPRFTAAVHRESGGNPLYALELLRALRDGGSLTDDALTDLGSLDVPVTEGLRTVVAARLDALPSVAASVVEAAAVLGAEFSLSVLDAASEASEHDIARAISALDDANVVESSGGPYRFRFTHAVTRRVALERIDAERRRELHRRSADALAACEVDAPEQMASHLLAAGEPRRAIPFLEQAADRAVQVGAYATAERHLSHAIDAMRATPADVDVLYRILAHHERVLDVLGRRDDQSDALDALAEVAAGDASREVEVQLRRALLLGHLDRLDDALLAATAARSRAAATSSVERARAQVVLGQLQSWAGQNVEAIRTLSWVADATLDPDTAVVSRFARGTALRFVQRYDDAEIELRLALDHAQRQDDQAGAVRARGALADLHTEAGQWDQALAEYAEAIDAARRLGYRQREAVGLVNLGNLHQSRGAPAHALESYSAAERIFQELDSQRGVAMVRLNRSWLRHRWLGEDEDARVDADQALSYFTSTNNRASGAVCLETLAAIARRRGQLTDSRELLDRALTQAQETDEHRAVAQIHRGMAATADEGGDPDASMEHLQTAIQLASRYGIRDLEPELRARRAHALAASGSRDDARVEATSALAGIDHALEPHRVLHAVSRVAHDTGDETLSRRCLEQARDHLARALADLDERQRDTSTRVVRAHRDILAAAEADLPRSQPWRFARAAAPRGRALSEHEVVTVELELGPRPTRVEERRHQVRTVIEQVRTARAVPTVADLAQIFDVSISTMHRDLRALRSAGFEATTRGTGVG